MKWNKYRLLLLAVAAVLFDLLQFSQVSFFGVKPNFFLIAVVILPFFAEDFLEGVFFISLLSFIFKFSPKPNSELLLLLILGMGSVYFKKILPWKSVINGAALVGIFTLILYVVLFPRAIFSLIFFKELLYNLVFGAFIFSILDRLNLKKN